MKSPATSGGRLVFTLAVSAILAIPIAGSDFASRLTQAAERETPSKRSPDFSRDRLVRALRSNREDAALRVLAEAEQFHTQHPDLPPALWDAIQGSLHARRIGEPLFRAIWLHGRLDGPRILDQQLSLLSADDGRIVMLAADNLASRKPACPVEPLIRVAERPEFRNSYGFRHAIVSAVAQIEEPASVDFLIATLAKYDGQLKYETARQLARLSGQNFGGKVAAWQTWWEASRSTFQFTANTASVAGTAPAAKPKGASAPVAMAWDQEVPTFLGMHVYARRVVLVLDQSRSMLSSVDDVTRLREAQRDFEETVRKLPEDMLFNVLAYESRVTRWQPHLVPATPQMKADAIQFANRLAPTAKTATYDALVESLVRDENVEAVLFLSDGEPTAGKIIDRPTIVREITRLNMFHRTSINTIGIDADAPSDAFLRHLSEENFGVYRPLR